MARQRRDVHTVVVTLKGLFGQCVTGDYAKREHRRENRDFVDKGPRLNQATEDWHSSLVTLSATQGFSE